jgi:hypothetical protein
MRRLLTDGGWNQLHTGTCRRRPFSGLPDRVSDFDRLPDGPPPRIVVPALPPDE